MSNNKKPAFEVFTAREGKTKSYFTRIGAAWPTKNGQGFRVDLQALPVNGKLILMPPMAKPIPETQEDDGPYIDDDIQI